MVQKLARGLSQELNIVVDAKSIFEQVIGSLGIELSIADF